MKRIFLAFSILLGSVWAYGQGAETSTAIIRLRENDYEQAKKYIDEAYEVVVRKESEGEEISEKIGSKFWYHRGVIYFQIHISKDPAIAGLAENGLDVATESFIRLFEVDVKKRYFKDGAQQYNYCVNGYINRAFDYIEQENWQMAMYDFEKGFELKQHPVIGEVDTTTLYNAALMAQYAKDLDNGIRLNKRLLEYEFGGAATYIVLSQMYKDKGDREAAYAMTMEGREKYPSDRDLLIEEVNFYIADGNDEKAAETLALAIEADPENILLYNAQGTILLKMGRNEEAVQALMAGIEVGDKKGLENMDASEVLAYGEANYSAGVYWIEQANALVEVMNNTKSDSEYNKLKEEQKGYFSNALPYFEKALECSPEDLLTLDALKLVYYRLDMYEKSAEMKKRIDAIQAAEGE
jgi:tetratricopeptide (TPR) repeat protein